MTEQNIMESPDFKKCVNFHGHICPGLSLGYRAAKTALAKLAVYRAEDEEIVAVIENDACYADAVQVLTGCTFGKGNFIHRDYGKMALTLFSRKTGRGVRVAMRNGVFDSQNEHSLLLQKVMRNEANDTERQRFNQLHLARSAEILAMDEARLFLTEETHRPLPKAARISASEPCDQCNEPTMGDKLAAVNGRKLCPGCAAPDEV